MREGVPGAGLGILEPPFRPPAGPRCGSRCKVRDLAQGFRIAPVRPLRKLLAQCVAERAGGCPVVACLDRQLGILEPPAAGCILALGKAQVALRGFDETSGLVGHARLRLRLDPARELHDPAQTRCIALDTLGQSLLPKKAEGREGVTALQLPFGLLESVHSQRTLPPRPPDVDYPTELR
jgi:hypothetical protein